MYMWWCLLSYWSCWVIWKWCLCCCGNWVSNSGLVSKSITIAVSSSSIIIGFISLLIVLTGCFSGIPCGTKGFVVPCTAGTLTPLALIWDLVYTKNESFT